MKTRILMVCLVVLLMAGCTSPATKQEVVDAETLDTYKAFETELDNLRQQVKIPGMSVAVVKDGELVWAGGFGYADIMCTLRPITLALLWGLSTCGHSHCDHLWIEKPDERTIRK